MVQLSKYTKIIIIVSVVLYVLDTIVLPVFGVDSPIKYILGFVPNQFLSGMFWQPLTYIFVHGDFLHLFFNMFVFAAFASELERIWGNKFFLIYYLSSGIGSIIFYFLFSFFFDSSVMNTPVVGASGGIYALLLAYGILFPERYLYVMFVLPLKAKYFVFIMGGFELFMSVFNRGGSVANLVHLSGIIVGYLLLILESKRRRFSKNGKTGTSGGNIFSFKRKSKRHLKIIINND